MAIRGRKPKPIALRKLEGNPGKRPLVKKVVNFNVIERLLKATKIGKKENAPLCPAWLSEKARQEWRRVAPVLKQLGLLHVIDRTALAGYCQAYARWREAEEFIETKEKEYINTKGKKSVIHPLIFSQRAYIAQKYLLICKNFLVEFGMTPSSRGRLTFPGGESKDEVDDLLD